ncbi:MAG: metallophosphoesterase [Prolixibacteraceae bacterium]|nr:metallophosphoesterase [Prolixibacteraceae bacterium]
MVKNVYITTILLLFLTSVLSVHAQNLPICAYLPESGAKLRVAIIPDTQGDDEEMGVAQKEITAIKDHLLNEVGGVDFVLHVGDVTNAKVAGVPDGEQEAKIKAELELFSALLAEPLAREGIPFYPIVGNHDYRKRTPWTEVFTCLFDGSDSNGAYINPETVPGGSASSPNADNYSYVVKHPESNTYFVMLDCFDGGNYYEWLVSKYEEIRNEHPDARIFSIQHMNLFSLTVHGPLDNIRDAKENDTPEKFREITEKYNIEGWFSGHNHYYHRAMHVDDSRTPLSFDYTVGAASFKVYDKFTRHPLKKYKVQKIIKNKFDDGRFKANYLLMDVFEKFVVIKAWYSDENQNGSFGNFRLADEYIYSTNGKQTLISKQESFTKIADTARGEGLKGTQMAVLNGTNTDTRTFKTIANPREKVNSFYLNVTTGWLPEKEWHSGKTDSLVSDILVLRGMNYTQGSRFTSPYTLKLSYNGSSMTSGQELALSLMSFLDYNSEDRNPGDWYNATLGVKEPNEKIKKTIGAPFEEAEVGNYGVDTLNNYVWARIDCHGDFVIGYTNKQ